jgi:aminobenzoyl-glutamate transport protein
MNNEYKSNSFFSKFLDVIEFIGNKLPHPVMLIFIASLIVIAASHFSVGTTATYFNARTGIDETITVQSLVTVEGLQFIVNKAIDNFTAFAPLGTVLVAMIGVGVAEGSGLIGVMLKKIVLSTPPRLITAAVVLAGILSNIASDVGYVVLVPLGAIVFLSFHRHPLAGIAAAFAGVSGGYTANVVIGTLDPLLSDITNTALKSAGIEAAISPAANYYFMVASTFIIMILGTWVTEAIVEPRLGKYHGPNPHESMELTKNERRGLIASIIAIVLTLALVVYLVYPEIGLLRDVNGTLTTFTFSGGLVLMIMLIFLVPGLVFGIFAKTIRSDKDLIHIMQESMAHMGGFIILAFFAAQFISYFEYTKLGNIIAIRTASYLQGVGFDGLPLLISFALLSGLVNLFIGSASAKWGIMAPIFIPILYQLGIDPEWAQVAYRIGDSATNIISPLMPYFAIVIIFAHKYDKRGEKPTGIGTLISMMLPYSIAFFIGWVVLLTIWYTFQLPVGL